MRTVSWVPIVFSLMSCNPVYEDEESIKTVDRIPPREDGSADDSGASDVAEDDGAGADTDGEDASGSDGAGDDDSSGDDGTGGDASGGDETGGEGTGDDGSGGSDDGGSDGPTEPLRKKVLTIMVDGWRPDVIAAADTPTIDALWPDAAYSLAARVEDTTISGSGQSTFVTGVHRDKHGVYDNTFTGERFDLYPYWFRYLDVVAPELITGAYHTWAPMFEIALGGEEEAGFAYFWDYTDEDGDARTTTQLQLDLLSKDLDAIVWMLSDLDTRGHAQGFSTEVPEYVAAMELIDEQIGQVLDAVTEREDYEREDWMIIISTDHAGSGYGHGDNIPEHRLVPMFVVGGDVVPGPIWPTPNTVSVVTTALAHLDVTVLPDWNLDGSVVGMTATAPPEASLGANLIINGDADMERGFWGPSPDAALPAWVDNDQVTAVKYGSEGFLSAESDGPESRGANFFCGGDTTDDTSIHQDIDLSALSREIDEDELGYTLDGWLGGYDDQNDRAEVVVDLYDSSGVVVHTDTLPAVTAAERDDETGLVRRIRFGMVPRFVRSARVTVNFMHSDGSVNDGYVDNLVLKFTAD